MLDQTAVRVARLRGRLAAESPGAWGLERLARNPWCDRLRALTLDLFRRKLAGDPPRRT